MKKYNFYKHPNNTSVCIRVLKVFTIPNDTKGRSSVKVEWWRCRASGKILYNMHIVQRFKMPASYWSEWIRLEDINEI